MKTITQACQNCNTFFEASLKEVKRGNGKYCSKKCAYSSISSKMQTKFAKINQPNVECSYCKKMFYKNQHRQKFSKSGMFFCCREHKDLAQTLEFGLKEIQPTHFGTGESSYREIAFRLKPKTCERCQYFKIPEILEVHHKDRNRENNTIENLEVLCPTCHMAEHFLNKDGKWKIKTAASGETAA